MHFPGFKTGRFDQHLIRIELDDDAPRGTAGLGSLDHAQCRNTKIRRTDPSGGPAIVAPALQEQRPGAEGLFALHRAFDRKRDSIRAMSVSLGDKSALPLTEQPRSALWTRPEFFALWTSAGQNRKLTHYRSGPCANAFLSGSR